MDSLELFKILFLSNQIHAINKILGALRNEDFDLNAQVACNKFELNNKIQSQNWDVVLCSEDSPISIETVKETIKSHNLELPIIFSHRRKSIIKDYRPIEYRCE